MYCERSLLSPIRAARAAAAFLSMMAPAFSPSPALASGLDAPMVGNGQSGPAVADAAAVHWNPAELAWIHRAELLAGAGLVFGRASIQRERRGKYQTADTLEFKGPLEPARVDAGKTGAAEEVTATPIAPVGDLFLAVPVLKDRITLGLGAYVPYAASLSFPENGAQAWQIREVFVIAPHVTLGAGARLSEVISVGAGVSYVSGFAELSKLQDFATLSELRAAFSSEPIGQENDFGPGAPTEVRELVTLSRPISIKRAFAHGVTFNLGLAYRPRKDVSLGLAYQHGARMRFRGDFAMDMNDDFFTRDLASQGLQYKPLVEGDAELSFSLPRRVTAGISYDASAELNVGVFVSYVGYSDFDAFVVETSSPDLSQPRLGLGEHVRVTLPRNWSDTVWAEASGRYKLSDRLLVSAAFGYQSPAAPQSTMDASSLDGHRLIGGLGGVLRVTERASLGGDIRVQGILPRTVTASDHDLGNGTYNLLLATIGGHLKVTF